MATNTEGHVVTTEYDLVVAGGGTVGCLVAARLAEADPALKILILEQGAATENDILFAAPANCYKHLAPNSTTLSFYSGSKESPYLGGKTPIVSTARCLGGGSSVNWMVYHRGARSDFDIWRDVYGNSGWDLESLRPLFDKNHNHGSSGPPKVSHREPMPSLASQWLDTATRIDTSRPLVADAQDFSTGNAYARWAQWVDANTGRRQDVPHHFIYPLLKSGAKILHVRTGSKVSRTILEDRRATGVEFTYQSDGGQKSQIAVAKRLVLVSAGAFGSPAIPERSGIGSPDVLKKTGIDRLVDLPGVGENYQDHPLAGSAYLMDPEDERDKWLSNDPEVVKTLNDQWLRTGKGPLAAAYQDCGAKLRPAPDDIPAMGSAFEQSWNDFYQKYPDKGMTFIGPANGFFLNPAEKLTVMTTILFYPFSIGYVHIRSNNPQQAPDFDPGFLSHPADIAPFIWTYKHGREIARRMPSYRSEYPPFHPSFPSGSKATAKPAEGPVPLDAPKLIYSEEDDAAVETFVRERAKTAWHSMGTCAMKARKNQGVVDQRLNVYGTQALKVADLSICPSNVGANTYSTALVVGEKAAVLIAEELGIKL